MTWNLSKVSQATISDYGHTESTRRLQLDRRAPWASGRLSDLSKHFLDYQATNHSRTKFQSPNHSGR
ncbi:Protein of unknown function [Pyronema omphalodes CBS 100304]|uniref:Uncharacterized protein n=1 Tax=Pyronema omphalodes (strain CBS 100304) TaxID=1076935 RepID=U4LD81_PYROM|nr:Protein of unknown function [Pyronema omphalodes CBS 100304]